MLGSPTNFRLASHTLFDSLIHCSDSAIWNHSMLGWHYLHNFSISMSTDDWNTIKEISRKTVNSKCFWYIGLDHCNVKWWSNTINELNDIKNNTCSAVFRVILKIFSKVDFKGYILIVHMVTWLSCFNFPGLPQRATQYSLPWVWRALWDNAAALSTTIPLKWDNRGEVV